MLTIRNYHCYTVRNIISRYTAQTKYRIPLLTLALNLYFRCQRMMHDMFTNAILIYGGDHNTWKTSTYVRNRPHFLFRHQTFRERTSWRKYFRHPLACILRILLQQRARHERAQSALYKLPDVDNH